MKLIIDISEGDYAPFKFGKYIIVGGLRGNGKTLMSAIYKAVANGTPLTESDDCVNRAELLKALDTWDKFGVDDTGHLFRLDNLSYPHYEPYIHYRDVIKAVKGMPSVQPKREKHDEEIIKETVESIWGKPPYTEVLDAIRAEILEKCFDVPYKNQAFDYGLKIVKWSDVLDIIDKYRKGDKE